MPVMMNVVVSDLGSRIFWQSAVVLLTQRYLQCCRCSHSGVGIGTCGHGVEGPSLGLDLRPWRRRSKPWPRPMAMASKVQALASTYGHGVEGPSLGLDLRPWRRRSRPWPRPMAMASKVQASASIAALTVFDITFKLKQDNKLIRAIITN